MIIIIDIYIRNNEILAVNLETVIPHALIKKSIIKTRNKIINIHNIISLPGPQPLALVLPFPKELLWRWRLFSIKKSPRQHSVHVLFESSLVYPQSQSGLHVFFLMQFENINKNEKKNDAMSKTNTDVNISLEK